MANTKLYIGACLEPCELGEEFYHLPPHVTLVPPFILPSDQLPALHTEMEERAAENENHRIILVGGESENFGSPKELTVRSVGGFMFQLHASSLMLVKALGGRFDERYTGLAWTPHVSRFEGALDLDERREIAEYQLFKYLGEDVKLVQAVYSANGTKYL